MVHACYMVFFDGLGYYYIFFFTEVLNNFVFTAAWLGVRLVFGTVLSGVRCQGLIFMVSGSSDNSILNVNV